MISQKSKGQQSDFSHPGEYHLAVFVLTKMSAGFPEAYRKVTGSFPEAYKPFLPHETSWRFYLGLTWGLGVVWGGF